MPIDLLLPLRCAIRFACAAWFAGLVWLVSVHSLTPAAGSSNGATAPEVKPAPALPGVALDSNSPFALSSGANGAPPVRPAAGVRLWPCRKLGLGGVCVNGCAGDLNYDGVVNHGDIDLFLEVLAVGGDLEQCRRIYTRERRVGREFRRQAADCNGDGAINFGDVDGFVYLLSDGETP